MGRVTNASIVGQQAAVLKLRIHADTHMALGKKIEDCASTAVLNKLDVREGSQGNIHHPSILLPPFLSMVFLLPTALRTLPGHPRCSLRRPVSALLRRWGWGSRTRSRS